MRGFVCAIMLAGASIATGVTPAQASPESDYRKDVREAQRDYRNDLRDARKDYRRDRQREARSWRDYRRYDWNRPEPYYGRYYPENYYRDGRYYRERRLSVNDRIYRGNDGRYYCRRSDGTTGLVIGAAVGGVIGNQLDRGGSRLLGTVIGGAAGALLGREVERGAVRCR